MPKRRARKRKGSKGGGSKQFPPMFKSQIEVSRRFRFQVTSQTATTTSNIRRSDLLNLLMVNLAGGTSSARLIAGVKVRRVEFWGLSNSASVQNTGTISIEWLSQFGPSREISDTAIPSIRPPYLSATPPIQSAASFWSLTGSNESEVLFTLVATPSGCVIDVFLDIILFDGESSVTITTTASGTTGQLYMGYLDGPISGGKWQPVSYTSLT